MLAECSLNLVVEAPRAAAMPFCRPAAPLPLNDSAPAGNSIGAGR